MVELSFLLGIRSFLTSFTGHSSPQAGKQTGTSVSAPSPPKSSLHSSPASPFPCASVKRPSKRPRSTFSASTRSSALSASRQSSSRRSLVAATSRASTKLCTLLVLFSQLLSALVDISTDLLTGKNYTTLASPTCQGTVSQATRSRNISFQKPPALRV